jgi:hypothetical protein
MKSFDQRMMDAFDRSFGVIVGVCVLLWTVAMLVAFMLHG